MHPVYRLVFFLFLVVLLSGCTTRTYRKPAIEWSAESVELKQVPFYPQTRYQCGPASLASILNSSGLDVDLKNLVDEVYLPGRKGTLQVEIIAAVRRYGRVPYQIDQNPKSIMDQLEQGLPVLVLLNLGYKLIPTYHYAVVIGYEPVKDMMILRSGRNYRLLMPRQQFLSAWRKTANWGLTVLPPGHVPDVVDVARYLSAVIVLESIGQWRAAELSYAAVLKKWPANTLARFGLANTLLAQGKLDEAAVQYRKVLAQDTRHKPARNNLADILLRLGRCGEAVTVLEPALISGDSESDIDRAISTTQMEIQESCFDSLTVH